MADLLQQTVGWLAGMRVKHASRTVTYSRGEESVELSATMGSTTYEVADEYGFNVEAKAMDFLVTAAELVMGGRQSDPEAGDKIRVTVGNRIKVYEVMDLGAAGHYRPSDPQETTLRIHTKQVDTESA